MNEPRKQQCEVCHGAGWIDTPPPGTRADALPEQDWLRRCPGCDGAGLVLDDLTQPELPPDPAPIETDADDDFPF